MKGQDFLQHPGAYPDMDYLLSEAAQARCVIAAQVLRHCPHIIEIGGFTTPISQFLTGQHRSVTVIDPLMRAYSSDSLNGAPCRVRHIPQIFQSVDIEVPERYGFVMLGVSLKHFNEHPDQAEQEWMQLSGLVQGAQLAVIESAIDWPLGRQALEKLAALPGVRVRTQLDLDLSGNPGMDSDHFRRRLLILEPCAA